MKTELIQTKDYLLLIDEEAEIKENTNTFKEGFNGDWFWNSKHNSIQRIGDITEFDFKIIAYYPLTKEAKELDLPLLPNPFERINIKEQLEYFIEDCLKESYPSKANIVAGVLYILDKATHSKQFSLEDIKKAIKIAQTPIEAGIENYYPNVNEVLEQLSTQQLPSEFIPEYEYYYHSSMEFYADAGFIKCSKEQYKTIKKEIPTCPVKLEIKTITNSEGKSEAVGMYKY